MTDQYVPKLRPRFLEVMGIKGLQPKTQTMYLRAMRDFTRFLTHVLPSGFHRIRPTGFLANGIRRDRIAKGRRLLDAERDLCLEFRVMLLPFRYV